MSNEVMGLQRFHPFFESFTFRRKVAEITLESFHKIELENNITVIP